MPRDAVSPEFVVGMVRAENRGPWGEGARDELFTGFDRLPLRVRKDKTDPDRRGRPRSRDAETRPVRQCRTLGDTTHDLGARLANVEANRRVGGCPAVSGIGVVGLRGRNGHEKAEQQFKHAKVIFPDTAPFLPIRVEEREVETTL